MLTEDDVRAVVDNLLATRTQKQLAEELGVSSGYLNDYIHFRREPGAKLLEGLGIRKVVLYERLKPNAQVVRRGAAGGASERTEG